jgi:hypothetical protein
MKTELTKTLHVLVLVVSLCLTLASTAGAAGYTLTIYANGGGVVTADNTNNPHPSGANITLTATASNGWYFANWSGDASGAINPLLVTMNSDLVITGNFLPFPVYSVALATNGQGSINLSPPGGSYLSNTLVTATATPATGWVFVAWSGITNTSVNPVSFNVNTNVALGGTFAQLPAFDVQPASVTNKVTSSVSFSGHANGDAPLSYQWFFSGGSIPSVTTNATLALTNVSTGQSGNYWLVATNAYGMATSHIASLTLTNFSGPTNVVNSPDEASLRAAIALGGWIGIGFNGTVTIANTINITNNVILDASTVAATISGGNAVRIFYIAPGASLTASNLTLANGNYLTTSATPADAGAIYNNGGTVTLAACTLTNNQASAASYGGVARAGAIFNNAGTVSLLSSTFISNSVSGGLTGQGDPEYAGFGFGGAVFNTNGSVNIVNSTFAENSCNSGAGYSPAELGQGASYGGAVFQASGTLTIYNSTFSTNLAAGGNGPGTTSDNLNGNPAYGGALAAVGGSVSVESAQFISNASMGGNCGYHASGASAFGGAIYSSAIVSVQDSSFNQNQAVAGITVDYHTPGGISGFGGAIDNVGSMVLNRCLISSNNAQGGSIISYDFEGANGFAGLGGGVFNASSMAATNCTLALNEAVGGAGNGGFQIGVSGNAFGGGIFNNTNATFAGMNLTVASNSCCSGAAQYYTNGLATGFQIANTNGNLGLHNSIIAYSGTNANAYGAITDVGYNISSDASASLSSGSSYNNTDPLLGPLGNYGGPTWCMMPLADSPAIDFGDNNGAPNTDQRGYLRPVGDGVDIGAVEYGSVPLAQPVLSISDTATNFQFSFTTTIPGSYLLQSSTNLLSWTALSTNGPFSGTTNVSQTFTKQTLSGCYFRLLVQ